MQWKRKQKRDVGKREVGEVPSVRRILHSFSGSAMEGQPCVRTGERPQNEE